MDNNDQNQLQTMKNNHDYFATAVQVLKTRVQFYAEEFQGIANTINFLGTLRDNLASEIEKIEHKKEVEKATYEMDLTHLNKEKPQVAAEFNS